MNKRIILLRMVLLGVVILAGVGALTVGIVRSQVRAAEITPHGCPAQTELFTDSLVDWTHVCERSDNLTLDSSNPQYFTGVTSRVKRTSNSDSNITYYFKDSNVLVGLGAIVYYKAGSLSLQDLFFVYTSSDNQHWTKVSLHWWGAPVATGGGWYESGFNTGEFDTRAGEYIGIKMGLDPQIYSPQIGQVIFASTW